VLVFVSGAYLLSLKRTLDKQEMAEIYVLDKVPEVPEEKEYLNREDAGKIRKWLDLADEVLATDEEQHEDAA
jgi:hypothetical protein